MRTLERWLGRAAILLVLLFLLAATYTNLQATSVTLITNSTNLANNAGILSGTITNTNKYMLGEIEFNGPSWSGTITANGAILLWLCGEVDTANFEDCDTTNFSMRSPDVVFPLRPANAAQRLIRRGVLLPSGDFKALMKNESGVSLNGATTTWTIKLKAVTPQSN